MDLELKIEETQFVVFDTETSLGTRGDEDRFFDMVEFGGYSFYGDGREIGSYLTLLKPVAPFNRESCKAMHITVQMLGDAPIFPVVAKDIANIMNDCVIVGQNIQFDIKAVKNACVKYFEMNKITEKGYKFMIDKLDEPTLDTSKLFGKLYPESDSKSLTNIATELGIDPDRTLHSALEDAKLTKDVFIELLKRLKEKGVKTVQDLIDFQEGKYGLPKQISLF